MKNDAKSVEKMLNDDELGQVVGGAQDSLTAFRFMTIQNLRLPQHMA